MADAVPFCRLSSVSFMTLYMYAERKRPADCKPGTTTLMMFMHPGPLYDKLVDLAVNFEQRLDDPELRDCYDKSRTALYGKP